MSVGKRDYFICDKDLRREKEEILCISEHKYRSESDLDGNDHALFLFLMGGGFSIVFLGGLYSRKGPESSG